jgi:DNA-binding transcriptional ArsR family regulator
VRDFVALAKALSDPTRVRILRMLQAGELCVCYLTAGLSLSQSSTSKHLAVLRNAGLVADRRDGQWVYYRLETEAINAYNLAFLDLVRNAPLGDIPAPTEAVCCRAVQEQRP